MSTPVPVVGITGFLGAGKTTVLNSVLRAPGARFGVVVNDFGTVDVDAGMVTGQVDEAASIAGGCLCCVPADGRLDEALARLAAPRLRLDAILVEASGVAEPFALSRILNRAATGRLRPGGLIEVVDALAYFDTVDAPDSPGALREPPQRFTAASLVVLTKTALLPVAARAARIAAITARVRDRAPDVPVIEAPHGRIDPLLVVDVAAKEAPQAELPLAEITREARQGHAHQHPHADQVTVQSTGLVDPGRIADLLEDPPRGVYRLKGTVAVAGPRGPEHYSLSLAGRHLHVSLHPGPAANLVVAIGLPLDIAAVRARVSEALLVQGDAAPGPTHATATARPTHATAADGRRRLRRHLRRS